MADNVSVTPGTGATIRTDEVGGVQYQVIKLAFGASGSATDVESSVGLPVAVIGDITLDGIADLATEASLQTIIGHIDGIETSLSSIDTKTPALGQALAAASVPVVLTAAQLTTLTPPAAITNYAAETGGNLAAIATSASILDDWDESDRAKVNIIAGQAGITAGAGSVAANTPRVTHASDDPVTTSIQLIDDAIVTDDNTFTPATTKVMMAGFEFDDTSPDTVNEGDGGAARMSSRREVYVQIRDAAGNERGLNVDANGAVAVTATNATASNFNAQVVGSIAHDTADSGNPIKIGYKAIAFGSNPTGVTANDRTDAYANRAGIPFFLGGHPNIITKHLNVTDADGAQTDTALITVGSGTKVVVTMLQVMADGANSGDCGYRIGFGTANTPSNDANAGMLSSHPGLKAGSGVVVGSGAGMVGVGADNEDVRLTCEDPAGGALDVTVTYFTIES